MCGYEGEALIEYASCFTPDTVLETMALEIRAKEAKRLFPICVKLVDAGDYMGLCHFFLDLYEDQGKELTSDLYRLFEERYGKKVREVFDEL